MTPSHVDLPESHSAPAGPVYLANPAVSCRESKLNGRVSLFNPDTNAVLGINATGRWLWQALARPRGRDQLVAHVLDRYPDLPADQATADVDAFLHALQPGGFIGLVIEALDVGSGRVPLPPCGTGGQSHGTAPTGVEGGAGPEGEVVTEDCERFYRGRSMRGTFRLGDRLVIQPVSLAAVQPGDIVIFSRAGQEGSPAPVRDQGPVEVVHRVVGRVPGGLITRGDNNRRADPEPVTQESLVGRVTAVDRAGRARAIPGGRRALLGLWVQRHARWARQRAWALLWPAARWLYRRLRASALVHRAWQPDITGLLVASDAGPIVKYIVRGRTVAKWWPHSGRFWCRRPYDLLIQRPAGRQGGLGRSV